MSNYALVSGKGSVQKLKDKDLVPGIVYVYKSGIVALYLGKDAYNNYLFYFMTSTLVYEGYGEFGINNFEVQSQIINYAVQVNMQNPCDPSLMSKTSGVPTVYAPYPLCDLRQNYKSWYIKSMLAYPNLPQLQEYTGQKGAQFVSAKDLVPGKIYYGGDGWRNSYVYLGRTSHGEFVYSFIGNEKDLIRYKSDVDYWLRDADCLKTNKKVKSLDDCTSDPKFIDKGLYKVAGCGYKLNLYGLTQEKLDYTSRRY